MRTYSHALLTWAIAKRLGSSRHDAAWATLGATLPDLPAITGVVWLFARRRRISRRALCEEACERGPFGGPDAALHSVLPVAVLLLLHRIAWAKESRLAGAPPAFLLGWAGHVLVDALTHADDARPILWPLSRWRPRSPISYWDRSRHALPFALAEHGALLLVAARAISRRFGDSG